MGDYAWIYRDPVTGKEQNLPYICERKQIIDLAASLTDGRWVGSFSNILLAPELLLSRRDSK